MRLHANLPTAHCCYSALSLTKPRNGNPHNIFLIKSLRVNANKGIHIFSVRFPEIRIFSYLYFTRRQKIRRAVSPHKCERKCTSLERYEILKFTPRPTSRSSDSFEESVSSRRPRTHGHLRCRHDSYYRRKGQKREINFFRQGAQDRNRHIFINFGTGMVITAKTAAAPGHQFYIWPSRPN